MKRIPILSLLLLLVSIPVLAQGRKTLRRLTTEDGLPSNTVRNIVQDERGFIWLGTDYGLCRYDGTQVRVFRIAENGMDQYVMALRAEGDSLVVSTGSGVFSFKPRTERFRRLPDVKPQKTGRGDQLVTHDGRQWTGTWEEGLMLELPSGGRQQVVSPQRDGMGHHIHKLYEYQQHYILIGCEEGLVAYDMVTGEVTLWETPKFVYAIESDHEGGLWIGTFYDGVYYVSQAANRFESVPGHVISRFCEDGKGRLWIASDDGGLSCLVGATSQDYPGQTVLQRENVHALQAVGDQLWVGTYSGGVYRLSGSSQRHYTPADGLYDNSSYVIYKDNEQHLWVATMGGLCCYDEAADSFLPVRRLDAVAISMAGGVRKTEGMVNGQRSFVPAVASEQSSTATFNGLWIATQGAGLYRFDGKTWKQYLHSNDTTTLSDNHVNCVYESRNGQLWVATQSGLCLYQPKTDSFRRIMIDHGKTVIHAEPASGEAVSSIVEASQGDDLWLSTQRGVLRYSPKTDHAVLFTRDDGLVDSNFQPNAGYRDANGYIYFGTANGYSRFLPSDIRTNKLSPVVCITGLEVFNRTINVGDELMPEALTYSGTLELSYSDRLVSISYAALSYVSPLKNQYAYRMDGFDREWNYVGGLTKAIYTNLPPGKYTFRVKATNNDGEWSADEAVLTIVVTPPFWLTWWAKLIYVLIVGAALWWFMRLRLRRAESRRHREEVSRITDIASNPIDNEFLVKMNSIIEKNYSNPDLNVNYLAEQLAISRSGLFAKTKALADVTPNEMIQIVRLKKAAQLLAEGHYRVSEVCYMVGFSSPSYFTKCFSKQFGKKPGEISPATTPLTTTPPAT